MRAVPWCQLAAAALLAGCLDRASTVCGDGRVCARGTVCVPALDLCADPDQVKACDGRQDGVACSADAVPSGACRSGVCLPTGCGNGAREEGEVCDDGNTAADDGCSPDCLSDETCGNTIVDRGEQCDCGVPGAVSPDCPGPNGLTGLCRSDCRLHCGDGVQAPDEACDPAAAPTVTCAGPVFDRGVTDCSASCEPVISVDTCRYIGWRTRLVQPDVPIVDVALVSRGDGYFVAVDRAGRAENYLQVGQVTAAPAPMAAVWAPIGEELDEIAIAVGADGTILAWEGGAFAPQDSGVDVDLHDVWGRDGDDAYAVGDAGTVLHWNGQVWSSLDAPTGVALRGVAGDDDRVVVVGDGGELLVHDAGGWSVPDSGTGVDLLAVWVAAGRAVAVGKDAVIREEDGDAWVPGRTAATDHLRAVWGSAEDGFFAAGDDGTVLFDDGAVWRPMALGRGVTGSSGQRFTRVTGVPGLEVGMIGAEDLVTYEGMAWSPTAIPTVQTITAVWGSATDDVYAVGHDGAILHHDGLTWVAEESPATVDLHAVWGTGPGDVYAVGDALTVLHRDAIGWSTLHVAPEGEAAGALLGVWAAPDAPVVVVGPGGIFHVDDGALVSEATFPARAVWGLAYDDLWAAGDGLLHADAESWSSVDGVTGQLAAVSGTPGGDVFAAGEASFQRVDGEWSAAPLGGPLHAVSASAPTAPATVDVFAAGQNGTLQRWDGLDFEPMINRSSVDLHALHRAGPLLYIGGDDGALDILVVRP